MADLFSWPTWLILAFVAMAFAGCSDAPDAPAEDGSTDTQTSTVATEAKAEGAGPAPGPWRQTLHFTPGNGLSLVPQEGQVTLSGGFSTFLASGAFSEFVSPPVDAPTLLLAEPADVKLFVHAASPGLMDPGFTYAVWLGSTRSMPVSQIVQATGVVQPDSVTEADITVDFGERVALPLLPGDALRIILAVNYDVAVDTGQLHLMTGGTTPSAITLTTQNLTYDPMTAAPAAAENYAGTLHGGDFTDCHRQEGVTFERHAFTVPEDAVYVQATATATTPEGRGDLDIDIYDGSTLLTGGHSPEIEEGAILAGPAIEPLRGKTLTLDVSACLGSALDYTVVLEQASLPQVDEEMPQ